MARINDILDKLNDNTSTVVDLPGNGDECFRSNALLIKKDNPHLELLFPPDSWHARDLKLGSDCTLVVEHNGRTINLVARLDSVVNDRRLSFTAREPLSPEALRDYFRVSISTPIEASYVAGLKEINAQSWKLTGTTLDMSGSGVLALFPEKPRSNNRIQLVITVSPEEAPIICLAHVVRSYRVRKNRYQVAFHFENIPPRTRDQIVSCCLQEQRRQLRENVETPL